MRKIAIIGANDSILPLIRKAKKKGLETHVFAWETGALGEKEADRFYPISIDEKEKILAKCREIGICAVASITSDFAVPTVNYIARNLNLVGNSEKTDYVARNKYAMRCEFQAAGLYTPSFRKVGADTNPEELSSLKYPLIVKPTDRWSSKGVSRVDSPDQLMAAVETAIDISLEKRAIVEEFMDGPEYSAECICFNGEYRVLTFTQKRTSGYPHYIETGHIQPSDIPDEEQDRIKSAIGQALKALDIQNGAAHAEFRILKDGNIGIIEIGARMGGDCIGTDLTPISTGMDFVGMVIDVASGKRPDFSVVSTPVPVEIRFIFTEDDYREYELLKSEHPERIVKAGDFSFDFSAEVVDSSTRHGYYIMIDL